MIHYPTKDLLRVVFSIRGTVFRRVLGRTLCVTLWAALVTWAGMRLGLRVAVEPTAHAILGVALGLLLVFRTNSCYDRYWEGRKLLGAMVNNCRDLARQASSYIEDTTRRRDIGRYTSALYGTIRHYLRFESDLDDLAPRLTANERATLGTVKAPPLLVAQWISHCLAAEAKDGRLSEERLRLIDGTIGDLIDQWGGAERILKTPVPFAYAHHIKTFLLLFCATLPFALIEATGWVTPLAALVVAYSLFGIEEIGVEIEDPFGYDDNDLPLDAIDATIAGNIDDAFRHAEPTTLATAPEARAGTAPAAGP